MVNPMDAVAGLVESVLPATPTAAAAAAGSGPNPTFTEDTLRMIMHNMFTGDSRLQGQMLSRYWAQEATYTLNEGLLDMHNRDSLAQLLRGVQLLATVEPEVLEITSTLDRAVILLNLNLSYKAVPLTWTKYTRIQVPTTITLTFAPDPSAVIAATEYVVTDLRQEMSLPDLFWWNPAWNWVNSRVWGPVSGRMLSQYVRLQDPIVSRFKQYIAGGAGYLQALIWLAEDATRGMHNTRAAAAVVAPPPPPPSADLLAAAAPDAAAATAAPAATVAVAVGDEDTMSVSTRPMGPVTPGMPNVGVAEGFTALQAPDTAAGAGTPTATVAVAVGDGDTMSVSTRPMGSVITGKEVQRGIAEAPAAMPVA